MKTLTTRLPNSIYRELERRVAEDGSSSEHIVSAALAKYLKRPIHTLFQVSTSGALVEGLYQGAVRVGRLLHHGDFGLGTFVDLDGEMVILDGVCYQTSASGVTSVVEKDRLLPYAVVTRFRADAIRNCELMADFQSLTLFCDQLRRSANTFYAFRVSGQFSSVSTRAMHAVSQGTNLVQAAAAQEEFHLQNLAGTLVGIWSPVYAGAFSVPGYHFHFLSDDCKKGGHLLECSIARTSVACCEISELHVALPETEEFLHADLTRDPREDLQSAENKRA